ncbi:hypothetical protein [Sphingobium yanoikuyae]|nr:hypothetical protein [Sphingobium yanoikuyae]
MRAVVMTATGGREVLEQIERPEPVAGPGEALVEIAVAGVNFMDIGVRQGIAWTDMPIPRSWASKASVEFWQSAKASRLFSPACRLGLCARQLC